jgi:hypothetical protein
MFGAVLRSFEFCFSTKKVTAGSANKVTAGPEWLREIRRLRGHPRTVIGL